MADELLSGFSSADLNEFKKDFMQMIKVGAEIDRYYGESKHDLDTIIPKYESLVEQFNKKYKGMRIKTNKTIENFKARVFVKEHSIKEFFANSASRLAGLRAIGMANFNQVDISDADNFARMLDSLHDRVYISYIDPESGTGTIAAAFDRKERMVELLYEPAEMLSENSAGFRISAFYALKEGYNKKIEVFGDASTFGFFNLLKEIEKREWYDKFNPRFLE